MTATMPVLSQKIILLIIHTFVAFLYITLSNEVHKNSLAVQGILDVKSSYGNQHEFLNQDVNQEV